MKTSPLLFARIFEKLKIHFAESHALDLKILLLVDFWKQLKPIATNRFYHVYIEEFSALIVQIAKEVRHSDFDDLSLDELHLLYCTIQEITSIENTNEINATISQLGEICFHRLILKTLYVGDIASTLAHIAGRFPDENHPKITLNEARDLSEIETLRFVISQYDESSSPSRKFLESIYNNWRLDLEGMTQDSAIGLFVEKDKFGLPTRGRMRTLAGKVRHGDKAAQVDEITFNNQLVAPDDPFVGSSYHALDAVRNLLARQNVGIKSQSRFHAFYEFANRKETFGGDSIGLAVAAVAYTQILKPVISREDCFISNAVAFTGGIDNDGDLTAVNQDTLLQKLERAFFSHVKYVVIPESDFDTARSHMTNLKKAYPMRQLQLIPASSVREVMENRNVIRPQKVCLGEFVVKKAYRYSRIAKIQVPLLLALLYFLLCLVYPKAWVGFDWRIYHLTFADQKISATSKNRKKVWESSIAGAQFLENKINLRGKERQPSAIAVDANRNGRDEVFARLPLSTNIEHEQKVYCFDDDGKIAKILIPHDTTNYPGDRAIDGIGQYIAYRISKLLPFYGKNDEFILITVAETSSPVRDQIMAFDKNGNIISGPYLHTGGIWPYKTTGYFSTIVNNGNKLLVIGCTNNRYERAILLVVDPTKLSGVSPPYEDTLFKLSGMQRGSQVYYVAFPETILSHSKLVRNYVGIITVEGSNRYHIEVHEGLGLLNNNEPSHSNGLYPHPRITYILDSNFIPVRTVLSDCDHILFQSQCIKYTMDSIANMASYLDSLKREVIVYYGDSIVHHEAANIDFYKSK